jgi:PAS domain S-box-containing protein
MIATDEQLIIRDWNAAASRMFGASAEQMVGTSLRSVVPQQQRDQAEGLFRRAFQLGEISDLEFRYHDDRGLQRELIVTISPITSRPGVRIGVSACIRDITRRIKLQGEVLEHSKMSSLGEMAGAFAHYFNNILGGITTSVDFARQSNDLVLKGRILDQIGDALSRATDLIKGLLSFAEGDQQDEDLCDHTELVVALVDRIEPELTARNIKVVLDMPDRRDLPVLPVRRVQVETVLHNVIENAIDAMPDGGTLTIAVSLETSAVVTRVSDTGHGMDEGKLTRIFEPFWTTKGPLVGGSARVPGLGLAVAHGLLHFLGGRISATSEVGKGSTFVISLPREKPS